MRPPEPGSERVPQEPQSLYSPLWQWLLRLERSRWGLEAALRVLLWSPLALPAHWWHSFSRLALLAWLLAVWSDWPQPPPQSLHLFHLERSLRRLVPAWLLAWPLLREWPRALLALGLASQQEQV